MPPPTNNVPPLDPRLPESWQDCLIEEFNADYMVKLRRHLYAEDLLGWNLCPQQDDIFAALRETPLYSVRVVIVGEEPYCDGTAHGLCFSVQGGNVPRSLENILNRVQETIQCDDTPRSPTLGVNEQGRACLLRWANQGVLLLNSVLTVAEGLPKSHRGRGWEQFTDKIIEVVAQQRRGVVFMLWGEKAQEKASIVCQEGQDRGHRILCASHPSPRSATTTDKSFADCNHFQEANDFFRSLGLNEIDWCRVTEE